MGNKIKYLTALKYILLIAFILGAALTFYAKYYQPLYAIGLIMGSIGFAGLIAFTIYVKYAKVRFPKKEESAVWLIAVMIAFIFALFTMAVYEKGSIIGIPWRYLGYIGVPFFSILLFLRVYYLFKNRKQGE